MCTEQLPLGGYPIAVNKYIISLLLWVGNKQWKYDLNMAEKIRAILIMLP